MKKIVFLCAAGLLVATSACSGVNFGGSEPMMSSSRNVDKATGTEKPVPPNFAQFSDIPVPEGSQMDLSRSLVFGGQNHWSGRLVFTAPFSQGGLFDFFVVEMPKFGWSEVTVVRSKNSVLTFSQGDRVATIQLNGDTVGSEVSFTVSPSMPAKTSAKIKGSY